MPGIFGQDSMTDRPSAIRPPENVEYQDALQLNLDDKILINVIDKRIEQSRIFYENTLDLSERRRRNKEYLIGHQLDETQLKYYNARYMDNVIYEAEATIKPIALSRLPDLMVKPANEEEQSKQTAKDLTELINSDIRKIENRRVLGLSFKHLPVYLTGILKAVWDPQKGPYGNYRFKVVHPDNLIMDHTATENNEREMDFISEATELSVKEIVMRFPNKEEELLRALNINASTDPNKMASKIKIWETWFTWFDKVQDPETGEGKWQRVDGVFWKYKKVVLGKMKNPYWDWQGQPTLFKYELGKKQKLNPEEALKQILGDQGDELVQDNIFYNFFSDPKKPYYFMGYEQWGEHPMDITSRIEQIIYLQDNINKRGKQITEMNDRAKGKHVFSTESGLTKEDVEAMDMDNPDEDLIVDGNVNNVHSFIPGTPAPAPLYTEQEQERQKAFSKMGTHSTTRGEKTTDVATTNQILREADFGRIDDLVEETINPAAVWMAQWAMQFIRLFYTREHMESILGKDGQITFQKVSQDLISDGMEVTVSASGVDKAQRRADANMRAQGGLTDPLSYFIDVDAPDPYGRTEKLVLWMSSPELYYQKYILNRDTQGMVQALNQQPVGGQQLPAPGPQASPNTTNVAQAPVPGGTPPAGINTGGGFHAFRARDQVSGKSNAIR